MEYSHYTVAPKIADGLTNDIEDETVIYVAIDAKGKIHGLGECKASSLEILKEMGAPYYRRYREATPAEMLEYKLTNGRLRDL